MANDLRPEDAAGALAEIRHRQEQVVERAVVPTWYWWAVAVLMVGLAATVDSRRPLLVGIGVSLFVVGVGAVTGRAVVSGLQHAPVRNDLLGAAGVLAILGFVATILTATLPTAFALKAAGVHGAATLGILAGSVVMVVGGPVLMRFLQRTMLARSAGDRP